MELPDANPGLRYTNDGPQTLGPAIERRMPEESLHEGGDLVATHSQDRYAVAGMPGFASVEAKIAREERGAPSGYQARGNRVVLNTLLGEVDADLMAANATAGKELALALGDVLVEDDHAEAGSRTYSSA